MQDYQKLNLSAIRPNPLNPRKNFKGKSFDELTESIKEKDVIQPILVRPVKKTKGIEFEIVFGERRFRAKCALAEKNGGLQTATIPALIRDIDDDTAFDLMTIENLQREDLTEMEKANSFKAYLDKKGDDSLLELAERTGIDARYIRRRIAVLTLPKKILKAWEDGHLKYGHLEQLMRLKDKGLIKQFFSELMEESKYENRSVPVGDLKRQIDNLSPLLSGALFDREKCQTCSHNSEVQKKLWGMDADKNTKCLNRACYKQKQNNHLLKHWKKTAYYKKFKTTGFRFREDVDWNDYNAFNTWSYDPIKPTAKCKKAENGGCAHYLTIIELDGVSCKDQACFGQQDCYNSSKIKKEGEKTAKDKTPGDGPRVPWHGTHFREKFYETELPVRIQAAGDELKLAQVALFSLLKSNADLKEWFAYFSGFKKKGEIEKDDEDHGGYSYFSFSRDAMFEYVSKMDMAQVNAGFREASIQVVMQDRYDTKSRHKIAAYFGIELEKEWRITEEYLAKKIIEEILEMGEQLEIFSDKAAQDYLFEKLNKKRGAFKSCKKSELIQVFLESGVDLTGKVPDEILNADKNDE